MYCINTIRSEELVDFLLNPFERTFSFDNLIYQKYEIDSEKHESYGDLIDCVFVLDEKFGTYDMACFIHYNEKDIFVYEKKYFKFGEAKAGRYITIENVRLKISNAMHRHIQAITKSKKTEIESNEMFKECYELQRKKHFQHLVNGELGCYRWTPVLIDNMNNLVKEHVNTLSIEDIISFYRGALDSIYNYAEELVFSKENLNLLALDKVQADAKEYVLSGVLSINDSRIKDFLEKTKDCGTTPFTVVRTSGEKVSCNKDVDREAAVAIDGDSYNRISIHDIEEVVYNGKMIYKRAY